MVACRSSGQCAIGHQASTHRDPTTNPHQRFRHRSSHPLHDKRGRFPPDFGEIAGTERLLMWFRTALSPMPITEAVTAFQFVRLSSQRVVLSTVKNKVHDRNVLRLRRWFETSTDGCRDRASNRSRHVCPACKCGWPAMPVMFAHRIDLKRLMRHPVTVIPSCHPSYVERCGM